MKVASLAAAMSIAILLGGCGTPATTDTTPPAQTPSASGAAGDDQTARSFGPCIGNTANPQATYLPGYVGLTGEEAAARAEAEGHSFQVVGRDGRCLPRPANYDENRISVYLENGKVTGAVLA